MTSALANYLINNFYLSIYLYNGDLIFLFIEEIAPESLIFSICFEYMLTYECLHAAY